MPDDFSEAEAVDVLQALREVTSAMDEKQVTLGSRYLFITPTLKDVLDDCSYVNSTWALPSSGIPGSQCFYSCSANLAGGNGVVRSSSNTPCTYFRIDAAGAPGYLTSA